MRSRPWIQIALLLAIPYAGMLSSAVLIPVLPKIASALQIPFPHTTWLITALSISAGLVVPLLGYLSDRYSRILVLVPALSLYGLGGALAGLAGILLDDPFPVLIAARILQGIGSAGTSVQAIALAGDALQPEEQAKVLGMIETSNALGKATGPVMGAGLGAVVWYLPFFLFPVLSLPIAIGLWLVFSPSAAKAQPEVPAPYAHTLWQAVRSKLLPLSISFLAGFWAVAIILLLLTLLGRELALAGIRGLGRGGLLMLPEVAVASAAFVTGRLLVLHLKKRGLAAALAGFGCLAGSLVGAALSTHVYGFLWSTLLAGVGSGTVLSAMNALVANAVPDEERGMITSLYGAFRCLGAAVFPAFFTLSTYLGSESLAFWLLNGGLLITMGLVGFGFSPAHLLKD